MGLTHYWRINTHGSEANYQRALNDIRRLIFSAERVQLAGPDGEGPPHVEKSISFNGVGEDGCEPFYLPETLKENSDFAFCKTRHRPYDVFVTGALCILKAALGDDVRVSSDATADEWREGSLLATMVLGVTVDNAMNNPEIQEYE